MGFQQQLLLLLPQLLLYLKIGPKMETYGILILPKIKKKKKKTHTPLDQGSHDIVYSHCVSCVCSQRFTVKDGI